MTSTSQKWLAVAAAAVAVSVVLGCWLVTAGAPYILAETHLPHLGPIIRDKGNDTRTAGRWADDYFVVEQIDAHTYAIGEPRYYQGNYSYLLVGSERALLFDAGSGARPIAPLVRSLTSLPVTVLPSHLHFDHVGNLGTLDRTAVLDVGGLRARTKNGRLCLKRYEFLGHADGKLVPCLMVDEWIAPEMTVDLGARHVRVLWTPGHTPSSATLYDLERGRAFVGDSVYPGPLYVFLPGASRAIYAQTADRLIAALARADVLFGGHMADPNDVRAPRLGVNDLVDLRDTLRKIESGALKTSPTDSLFLRSYTVNERMMMLTGAFWNNQ
jgi:glyoxylase-like metal-dependent hydrolase (beta-lactamase superfamily II)